MVQIVYLEDRRQQTTILGATSSPSPVMSGVPQGSILGPVLFPIYGNDLNSSVINSSVATFADDTKLFKEVASNEDAAAMQNDLNNFNSSSSGEIELKLNNSKCKVLRITRKYHQVKYPYNLEDKLLETPNYELDLGVWISNNLTWRKQVTEQAAKANCMLGYIERSTRTIKNSSVRQTLYLAFVRSKIEYATQVWSPQTVELIARLERVQRRATKYILDLPFLVNYSYSKTLIDLNLLPISYWHEYMDMLFFYKANNRILFLSDETLPKERETTRSEDPSCSKYEIKKCKTSTYQQSFTVRSARIWDTLPRAVTNEFNSFCV